MSSSSKKEEERLNKKIEDDAKKTFSLYTIQLFGLNKRDRSNLITKDIDYSIRNEIELLKNEIVFKRNRTSSFLLDVYVYSGKLNSVIGLEGMRIFKDKIYEHMSAQQDSGSLKVDKSFFKDLVYRSGIYIDYEYADKKLLKIYEKFDHRGVYRNILLNQKVATAELLNIELINKSLGRLVNNITDNEFRLLMEALDITFESLIKDFENYVNSEESINIESLLERKKVA